MTAWQIDPETFNIIDKHPPPGGYTAEEFEAQERPSCPICGTPVDVVRTETTNAMDPEPRNYIPRNGECPNGCTPKGSGMG